ncbi:MAG: DUF58 domain-containing protein [Frankiales bacterium]|nr:MAG: DUF58 domain-containing protein [Frankiales bacterium]
MRPTAGAGLALVGAAVLHQLARLTGGGWLALGSGALLALPIAALLLRPRLDGIQVVAAPVHLRRGGVGEQAVTVRNAGRRPSPPLRLTDDTPGLEPTVVAVPALAPGASVSAVLVRVAVARGWSSEADVVLESSAPFGLVRVRRSFRVAGPFVVAPAPAGAPVVQAAGEGAGDTSSAVAGHGTEVLGLRPYRPGDSATAVHARASARQGRPVVLERERETGAAVVVLCAQRGSGPGWEALVERSCALAETAVREGRPPRLLATGLTAPVRPSAAAVLDWHAALDGAQPVDARTQAEAVRAAAHGGSVVVLGAAAGDLGAACATAGARLVVLGPA